jgi:hypothetical protein
MSPHTRPVQKTRQRAFIARQRANAGRVLGVMAGAAGERCGSQQDDFRTLSHIIGTERQRRPKAGLPLETADASRY